jgi:hypothetical protein
MGVIEEVSGTTGDLSTDPVPFIGAGLTGLVEIESIGIIIS